jgi:hypothetical protein
VCIPSARSTSQPFTGSMPGSTQQQGTLASGGFSVLELQDLLQQQVSGTYTAKQLISPFWLLAARQCGSRGVFAEKRAQVAALLLLLQWSCRVSSASLGQTQAGAVRLSAFRAAAAGVVGDASSGYDLQRIPAYTCSVWQCCWACQQCSAT